MADGLKHTPPICRGPLRSSLPEDEDVARMDLKLGLPPTLRRFFATTNCIENVIGTLRHVTRNIKRWRDGDMRRRWIGLGLLRAAERFRRIKRHGDLGVLVTALGAAQAAERRESHRGHRWRKREGHNCLKIDLPEGGRYIGLPLRAVN
jgi:hypothetical protein